MTRKSSAILIVVVAFGLGTMLGAFLVRQVDLSSSAEPVATSAGVAASNSDRQASHIENELRTLDLTSPEIAKARFASFLASDAFTFGDIRRAIASLERSADGGYRLQLLFSVFAESLAERDAAKAFDRAGELLGELRKRQLLEASMAAITATDGLDRAAEFLQRVTDTNHRRACLRGIVSVLKSEDPATAIALVNAESVPDWQLLAECYSAWTRTATGVTAALALVDRLPDTQQSGNASALASAWSTHDPVAAVAWASTTGDNDTLSAALTPLLESDPDAAMAVAATAGGVHNFTEFRWSVLRSWAQKNAAAARSWVLNGNLPREEMAVAARELCIGTVRDDPVGTLDFMEQQIPVELWPSLNWEYPIEYLAKIDLRDALARATRTHDKFPEEWNPRLAGEVIEMMAKPDAHIALEFLLDAPPVLIDEYQRSQVLRDVASTDPRRALEALPSLIDPDGAGELYNQIFHDWASRDLDGLVDYARGASSADVERAARALTRGSPSESSMATAFVDGLNGTDAFVEMASLVVGKLASSQPDIASDLATRWNVPIPDLPKPPATRGDPIPAPTSKEEALAWLAQAENDSGRERQLGLLVRRFRDADPGFSFELAQRIPDAREREKMLQFAWRAYRVTDPVEAEQRLRQLDLPEEKLEGMLQPYQIDWNWSRWD